MISQKLYDRFYADPKYQGTTMFYRWIRETARPTHRVLNLGAGPATGAPRRCLNGAVAEVIGADIDSIVLQNEELDRAYLIEEGKIPIENAYFDLIYSDFVLEHVEEPFPFLTEVHRLLKPGGSFFFRTPNLYHYVAIASHLTPHFIHKLIANRVRGMGDEAHEPWPTRYRMNSRATLKSLAAHAGFDRVELRLVECEPSYLVFNVIPFLAGVAYERLVNATPLFEGLRASIIGRFRKPD